MIYHRADGGPFPDVAIGLTESPGSQVYNNTIYMEHCYPSAIEYRFPGTTGVLIANNSSNKPVRARDGATARLAANITTATADWFVASAAGDLHLSDEARAVDRGVAIPDLVEDFDHEARPRGSSVDVGADESYSP